MGVLNEPGRPAVTGRGSRKGFPSRIVGAKKPAPLDLEWQGRVHEIKGAAPALGRENKRRRISGTGVRRGILVRKNHLGDVVAGKMAHQKRLVIVQFGADIRGGTVAGKWIGVIIGMVEHVPSRRPHGLQAGPVHEITAAPRGPSPIGPGTHHRFPCPPSHRVQKRFPIVILGQSVVIKGQRIGPMEVVEKGGFGGGTGSARGPIDRCDHNGTPGRGKESGSGRGNIRGWDRSAIRHHRDRGACPHIDQQRDLSVIDQGRNGRIIHRDAEILVCGK